MALFLDSWLTELLVALSLAVLALYLWFGHSYTYWRRRGVPYLPPSFPFGNMAKSVLGRKQPGLLMADFYRQLKGHRFGGFFALKKPILLLRDPDLIRAVLVKDFQSFHDRGFHGDEDDPMSNHLLALNGQKWKKMRAKLSPTFTSGKMRMMFETLRACGHEMISALGDIADRGEPVEMRELAARFTTDVIASVVFGIEIHSQKDPNNEFREWGRKSFSPSRSKSFKSFLRDNAPMVARLLGIKATDYGMWNFFRGLVGETVAYRETNNVQRNDFMHLLMQLKNKGYVELDEGGETQDKELAKWKLSLDDLTVQAIVFFMAGFETSSTTMSFALHELALNPDVQSKLQEEIDASLKANGGDLSYEALISMKYLDKVVSETLRKHSPAGALGRECNTHYPIEGSDVVLEPGTMVMVPIYALHHDPQHFPEPDRFDPERFSEQTKASRHQYVYLPFGEGPRNCIGMRFGILQAKVGLTYLLSKLNVEVCEKTKSTLSYHPSSVVLMSDAGLHLKLSRRQ